jgi:iron complex outermembrane recepter protein
VRLIAQFILFAFASSSTYAAEASARARQTPTLEAIEVKVPKPPQPARSKSVPAWEFDALSVASLQASLPGVSILARQNEVQDAPMIVRGFGARAAFGTRGVRMFVDGIPQSGADGQGQLGALAPGSHARLRWLVGPAANIYGFNAAAVLHADWRNSNKLANHTELASELSGSANERSAYAAQAALLRQNPSGAWRAQATQIQQVRAREFSQSTRQQLQFNLVEVNDLGQWNAHALWLNQPEAQDAGTLSLQELRENSRRADALARAVDAGKSVQQWQSGGAWQSLDRAARASLFLGQRDVTQVLAIAPARQRNRPAVVADTDLQRTFFGADWAWRWLDSELAHGELWLEHQVQLDQRLGYENFVGPAGQEQLGVRGLLKRDESSRTELSGLALSGRMQLGAHWWGDFGWRWNRQKSAISILTINARDALRFNGPTGFGAVSVSPEWSFWRDQLSFSVGRGAETPTLTETLNRPDAELALNPLRAASNHQFELRYRASNASVASEFALYHIRSKDELVIVENQAGRAVFDNAQSTARKGVEAQARWRMSRSSSMRYLGLWQNARYRKDVPVAPGSVELRLRRDALLPALPAQQHQVQWQSRIRNWRMQLGWQFRGALVIDDRSQSRIDSEHSWSAALNRRWRHGSFQTTLGIRIDDLFDQQRIAGININDANARYFDPAEGRRASVNWRLQW